MTDTTDSLSALSNAVSSAVIDAPHAGYVINGLNKSGAMLRPSWKKRNGKKMSRFVPGRSLRQSAASEASAISLPPRSKRCIFDERSRPRMQRDLQP